jgi:hypothetical protein
LLQLPHAKGEKEEPMSKHGNLLAKQRAREFVSEYLSKRSCTDCRGKDFDVLTFDHVSGEKKNNISDMVRQGYSIKAIALEIEKTEVVCFNCHMRREQSRRGYNRFGRFGAK